MRLVLVNLYPPETMARYLLAAYQLKAHLQRHLADPDLTVEVLDFSSRDRAERIVPAILERRPDLVGFCCYLWNMDLVAAVVAAVKRSCGAICVLGGPEISGEVARTWRERGLGDRFCVGAGEEWLLDLVRELRGQAGEGSSCPQEVGTDEAGLGRVPSVYLSGVLEPRLYRFQQAFLETQRGCRNRCAYCLYHKNLSGVRYFPLDRVLSELDHLILEERISALRIFDAVFTSDLPRAKRIVAHLGELKARPGVRLPWTYWEFTVDSVDQEFLEMVSGLKSRHSIHNSGHTRPTDRPQLYSDLLTDYTVVNCVGVQSLAPEVLKAVGRPATQTDGLLWLLDAAKRLNLALKLDLMLGLPRETRTSYFQGLELVLAQCAGTDHVLNVHRVQLLPGTSLERRAQALGLVRREASGHLVLATPDFPEGELERASRLTAVLFRVVNSPFRDRFLRVMERRGAGLEDLLEDLLAQALASPQCNPRLLAGSAPVDDVYWNDAVFKDLPSRWIECSLTRLEPAP